MDGQITQRERLSKIEETLNGNGKDGLKTKVRLIEEKQDNMSDSLEKIATSMSAIAKDNSNREAVRRVLGNALKHTAVVVGIFGTIITLLIKLL
jgi:hypothetical protein